MTSGAKKIKKELERLKPHLNLRSYGSNYGETITLEPRKRTYINIHLEDKILNGYETPLIILNYESHYIINIHKGRIPFHYVTRDFDEFCKVLARRKLTTLVAEGLHSKAIRAEAEITYRKLERA